MSNPLLPSRAMVRVVESNETLSVGTLDLARDLELKAIRVLLYVHGTALAGTERVRAKLYADSSRTLLLHTGEWSELSDAVGLAGNWWGWFTLYFSRPNLAQSNVYYLSLEVDGYTRNANTYYLGFSLNWPIPSLLLPTLDGRRGLMLQILGYRDVT